ncbi:MAG: hypothetical protein AYK18_17695 [Theionarchaea archaeon DG-70]|nr:MAG: hypothetical protein AYK18_17695 [Theionarchaea archaeon DG-70]
MWQDDDEVSSGVAADFFVDFFPENSLVLEQGCGTGHGVILRNALAGCVVEGFDISGEAIKICTEKFIEKNIEPSRFRLWVQDMRVFDYPKEHYDGIVDFYTLQHFPIPLQKDIIRKIYNSLKHRGLFLLGLESKAQFSESDPQITFAEDGCVTIYHSESHVRHFYPWDIHSLESYLESVGFRIVLTYRKTQGGSTEIVCFKPQK